jgi:hypothetical protein
MKYDNLHMGLFNVGNNVEVVPASFATSAAPHVGINRITYTVPDQRRALLTSVTLGLNRFIAPTVGNISQAVIDFTRAGGNTQRIIGKAGVLPNVGDDIVLTTPVFIPMFPKDSITVDTTDLSTGGQVYYSLGLFIIEFDLKQVGVG